MYLGEFKMNTLHKQYDVKTQAKLDELWSAYCTAETISENSDYQPERVKAAELAYREYVLAKQEAHKEKLLLQNGEIFGVLDRPCMVVARVAVRNGKVNELVDVELTKDEAANIEKYTVNILTRAFSMAACFQ